MEPLLEKEVQVRAYELYEQRGLRFPLALPGEQTMRSCDNAFCYSRKRFPLDQEWRLRRAAFLG